MTRSSSPSISPSISTVGPSTVAVLSPSMKVPFPVKREWRLDAVRQLDVHFDGATEPRAFGHDDAGSLDIPHDLGIGGNLDAIGRARVAVHLTLDGHVFDFD